MLISAVYSLSAQSIPQGQGHRSLAGTMSLKLRSEATLPNTPVVTLTPGASKYTAHLNSSTCISVYACSIILVQAIS